MNEKPQKYPGLIELLSASLIYGLTPLIAVLSGGETNPLLFMALWSSGGVIGLSVYLGLGYRPLFQKGVRCQLIDIFLNRRRVYLKMSPSEKPPSIFNPLGLRTLLLPIHQLGTLFFVWALNFVNEVAAAVIFESGPILFALVLKRVSEKEENGLKEFKYNTRDISLSFIAFFAVGLVILSDTSVSENAITSQGSFLGFLLLAISLFFYTQRAIRIRQSQVFVRKIVCKEQPQEESIWGFWRDKYNLKVTEDGESNLDNTAVDDAAVPAYLYILALGRVLVVFLVVAVLLVLEGFNIATSFHEPISLSSGILAFFGGTTVTAIGAIYNAKGTLKAKNLRTQIVRFSTPVIGVIYLGTLFLIMRWFGASDQFNYSLDINWAWFWAGLIGVLTFNIILNLESEQGRFGLTSFVGALWVFGVLVYFRDEWVWWVDNVQFLGTEILEYYGFLGVSATVFALLIAFEVSRVESRTAREEELAFSLLTKVAPYSTEENKVEEITILEHLEKLDSARDTESIERHYRSLYSGVVKYDPTYDPGTDSLTLKDLNILAHSKQQGSAFSGRVAIILLALFTISLSLGLRPAGVLNLTAIFVDSFAFLLAAVTAYLTFHLFDLLKGRRQSIIEKEKADAGGELDGKYLVEFVSTATRNETRFAVGLIVAVTLAYVGLYAAKWLV